VTGDGSVRRASEDENADLFWALRGGGGNFGVVTRFTYRLHPVTTVLGGPTFFELDDAPAFLAYYREFIAMAPREFGGFAAFQIAPPLPFIPADRVGEPLALLVSCWTGSPQEGRRILQGFHEVARPVADAVGELPYAALNSMFDPLLPAGLQHYWKASFATELTDEAIAEHMRHGPELPNVESAVHFHTVNGAVHDLAPDATAYGHRDASIATVIAGMWPDPADNEHNIGWVKEYHEAIAPHSQPGGYVNFASADDQPRAADNYGANHARLREVKRRYDPGNLFHLNQNIRP
jgi:FAD/FMN-containing dehydrogenase